MSKMNDRPASQGRGNFGRSGEGNKYSLHSKSYQLRNRPSREQRMANRPIKSSTEPINVSEMHDLPKVILIKRRSINAQS